MIYVDDFLTRRWWDTEPYPYREVVVNPEYVEKFFTIVKPDAYLDEELLQLRTLEVLRGHEHHNIVSHSYYLTKPIRKFMPTEENVRRLMENILLDT